MTPEEMIERAIRLTNSAQYAQAIELLDSAVELAPDDWRPRFHRGLVYAKAGQTGLAAQDLDDVTFDALDDEEWRRLANTISVLRQDLSLRDRLVDIVSRMAQTRPHAYLFAMLAEQLMMADRLEEAATAGERARELDLGGPFGLRTLAVVYDDLGRKEEALECWERLLEINPLFVRARDERNRLLAELGRDPVADSEPKAQFTPLEKLDKGELIGIIDSLSAVLMALPELSDSFESSGDFHSFLVELAEMGQDLKLGRVTKPWAMRDH